MNAHKNARLSFYSRELMIRRIKQEGWPVAKAAHAAGVSERTAYKWLARYRGGGAAALHNAKPVPRRLVHRLTNEQIAAIENFRRQRLSGPGHRQTERHPALHRWRCSAPPRSFTSQKPR